MLNMLSKLNLAHSCSVRSLFRASLRNFPASTSFCVYPPSSRNLHTANNVTHNSNNNDDLLNVEAAIAVSGSSPFIVDHINLNPPKSNELLVRIVASGLCHTDIAVKERSLCEFPIVLGHEGAGVIERIGNSINSNEFNVGDHVLLSYASCGTCNHCLQAKPSYCLSHGFINFSGLNHNNNNQTVHSYSKNSQHNITQNPKIYGSFFQQSSFSTHCVVTTHNTIKVNKQLDLNILAPLGCGIQTGSGAILNSLQVKTGENIAIFGCGAVGLSSIMAAKLVNANIIIAIDLNENRLKLAKELGATHCIQINGQEKSEEISKQILSIPSIAKYNGIHYGIDTSGQITALKSAFQSLKPMGIAALIGGSGNSVDISMADLLHGRSVRGIVQGDSVSKLFLPKLIQLWENGLFPFHKMITFFDGLHSLNDAIKQTKSSSYNVIKPVIRISKP